FTCSASCSSRSTGRARPSPCGRRIPGKTHRQRRGTTAGTGMTGLTALTGLTGVCTTRRPRRRSRSSCLPSDPWLPATSPWGNRFATFLEPSFAPQRVEEAADHGLELTLMVVSSLVAVAGIAIAFYFFLRNRRAADRLAEQFGGVQRVLLNKYYVDEIYDAVI